MKWLKLYTEILDDPKIRLLAFEDRWHYVALLCCKAEGIQDERDGIWERLLRVKLGLAEVEFDSLKKRLLEVCLIDESWNPTGWDKRQAAQDARGAERQKRYREKLAKRNVTHNVTATSQVEDRSKNIELEKGKIKTPMSGKPDLTPIADRVIAELNSKTGKSFRPIDSNRKLIIARIKQGFTEADCMQVVANRCQRWIGTSQEEYLRPKTLFAPSNFEGYLNDNGESNAAVSRSTGQPIRQPKQTAADRLRAKLAQDIANGTAI